MSIAPPSTTTPPKENLSLEEMLRVMDVATELRKQRESVEKEFAIDETKQRLRERLLESTTYTGERVTEAEVDAAISRYFDTLHVYEEPTRGVAVKLAKLYVNRGQVSMTLLLLLMLAGTGWYMLHLASTTFSQTARQARQGVKTSRDAAQLASGANAVAEQIRAIARDTAASEEVQQLMKEVDAARQQLDLKSLTGGLQRLKGLFQQLNETYEIRIVTGPNTKSGIDRYFEDAQGKREAGYYVIVEARDSSGNPLTRSIHNAETDKYETVTRWAERVPKEVYDRIKADKQADGVLNETLFATKQRGYRDEEIKLPDPTGKPLPRLGQITNW